MSEIQPFDFEGTQVRTLTTPEGETWWVLADVCKALGITNARNVAARLDDDYKGVHPIDTLGGVQNTTIINESGLYEVILRSDKPDAKRFRKWVTGDVLPSIRKHGAYMTEQTVEKALASPDFLIRLATQLKQEREEREKAQQQVEALQPKALFADAVETSHTTILVGELAKILRGNGIDIGQTRLFAWLRDNGWLMKTGSSRNMPTQKAMEMGLFKIKETTVVHSDGHTSISKTPKITGKGQTFFIQKFLMDKKGQ